VPVDATLEAVIRRDRRVVVTALIALIAVIALSECPYMDSPSFASKLYLADMARLHTYIRPLELAYVDAGP